MSNQTKLPSSKLPEVWNSKEAWRVFGIMSEFVSATDRLNIIQPAVSIFGSARTKPNHPYYKKTEDLRGCYPMRVFPLFRAEGPALWKLLTRAHSMASRPV